MTALTATLGGRLALPLDDLALPLRYALEKAFTLPNPRYVEAMQHGRSTPGLRRCLTYYQHGQDVLSLPRGAIEAIHALCREHDVVLQYSDHTQASPAIEFSERVLLSPCMGGSLELRGPRCAQTSTGALCRSSWPPHRWPVRGWTFRTWMPSSWRRR